MAKRCKKAQPAFDIGVIDNSVSRFIRFWLKKETSTSL
jgi:hypothetical protein